MRITIAIATLAMLAGPAAAAPAQDTAAALCRPTALGTTSCPPAALRPVPRPPDFDPPRGLDAVQQKADPDLGTGKLIPQRRTNSFGQTRTGPGETGAGGASGPCRRDALGNLRCR